MRHSVMAALAFLPLVGCGPTLPEALRDPSGAEALDQGIRDHCASIDDDRCPAQMEEAYCRHRGGRWVGFTNGCRDLCGPQISRGAGLSVICTTDMPMGCECGRDRCWDGTRCVDVPPPQGRLEVDIEPPAACFEPWTASDEETPEQIVERITQAEQCLTSWIDERTAALEDMNHIAAPAVRQCLLNARLMAVSHARSARQGLQEGENPRFLPIRREAWERLQREVEMCGASSL